MSKRLFHSILFACIAVIIVSCTSSVPKQAAFIPKDAFLVADFNTAKLAEKCKKGNINWDSLFTNMLKNADPGKSEEMKKQLAKMSEAGIDFTDHFFVYVKMSGSMMTGQSTTTGIVAGMKDASKFETYIKSQQEVSPVQQKDNYSYTILNHELAIGWNKEVAILVYATPPEARDASKVAPNDGQSSVAALDQMMHLKKEESVVSINDFTSLLKEKADILYWTNSEGVVSSIPLVGMTKLGDLFKGTHTAGAINFEDGKAVATVKAYMGKDLADILQKYPSTKADMNMVTQFPSMINGYLCFSFNPKVLQDIIKYAGIESTANQFLEQSGITLEDITKTFTGDMAFILSDYSMKEKTIDFDGEKISYTAPELHYIFNAKIADAASYNKIAAALTTKGFMEQVNGQYLPKDLRGSGWLMNGKNLITGNSDSMVQQYIAGKGNTSLPKDFLNDADGKPFSMFININQFIQQAKTDSSNREMLSLAKSTFKDFRATTDKMEGNSITSHMELYTMNDKENSLVSLIHYMAAAAVEMKHKMDALESGGMVSMDSMQAPIEDSMMKTP
ncbi:MAG: DUF4836 family protein [Bacteroidetes bacterium]|nr:DUF4836 family protein [Bacteroidota bacterium]